MSLVLYEQTDDQIGILTLNRGNAANALSLALLGELNEKLEEIEKNNELRVLIITGAGEKAFCAGADLKERADMNEDQVIDTVRQIGDAIKRIENLSVPTITAINGAAFGGGLELALATDIRLASDHAKMGLTETSLAIIPGAGGTQRLARLIGLAKAKYYILTAKRFDSQEAMDIGLIERVTVSSALLDEAVDVAKQIASNGPIGVKMAKKAIDQGYDLPIDEGLALEKECYLETIPTKDRQEGLQAFKEKRKPNYVGQ